MSEAKNPSGFSIVLALDVGSSSVRCTAYRWIKPKSVDEPQSGLLEAIYGCSSSRRVHAIGSTGLIHLNKKHKKSNGLLDDIDLCIDDELKRISAFCGEEKYKVVGLGFSTFCMNLIGVDDEGEIVGPTATMSYACSTKEVIEECKLLEKEMSHERLQTLYQATGAPSHTAPYALAQLRAFYRHHLEDAKRVYKWQTIAGLCLSRWTGRDWCPMSYSEASWTGLLDYATCTWDKEAMRLLPEACIEALPPLLDCTDVVETGIPEFPECLVDEDEQGVLDNSVASVKVNSYWNRWPELQASPNNDGCKFFLGIGDGACASIGSKCCSPSRISVTVGTSAAARICLPLQTFQGSKLAVPPGLFVYRLDKSHVILGGALTDGGSVVEWCRSLLGLETDEDFERIMNRVEQLAEEAYHREDNEVAQHTIMIPFLSGERSVGFRSGATGALTGLTRDTTQADIVKTCLEGVVLRLIAVIKLLRHAERHSGQPTPREIVASGNALEVNHVWRQMIADGSGIPVELDPELSEATSRGAARMVAIGLTENQSSIDLLQEVEPFSENVTTSKPHPLATVSYWRHASKQQEEIIHAMSPSWKK